MSPAYLLLPIDFPSDLARPQVWVPPSSWKLRCPFCWGWLPVPLQARCCPRLWQRTLLSGTDRLHRSCTCSPSICKHSPSSLVELRLVRLLPTAQKSHFIYSLIAGNINIQKQNITQSHKEGCICKILCGEAHFLS